MLRRPSYYTKMFVVIPVMQHSVSGIDWKLEARTRLKMSRNEGNSKAHPASAFSVSTFYN